MDLSHNYGACDKENRAQLLRCVCLTIGCMAQEQLAAAAARSIQGRSAVPTATSSGSAGQTQSGKASGTHGKSLLLPNGHSMPDSVKVGNHIIHWSSNAPLSRLSQNSVGSWDVCRLSIGHSCGPQAERELSVADSWEVNYITCHVQEWLVSLPELDGLWGMERFGLADIRVCKALEGLEGADQCTSYKFVEERSTWAAEKARLEKLIQSRTKQVCLALRFACFPYQTPPSC